MGQKNCSAAAGSSLLQLFGKVQLVTFNPAKVSPWVSALLPSLVGWRRSIPNTYLSNNQLVFPTTNSLKQIINIVFHVTQGDADWCICWLFSFFSPPSRKRMKSCNSQVFAPVWELFPAGKKQFFVPISQKSLKSGLLYFETWAKLI